MREKFIYYARFKNFGGRQYHLAFVNSLTEKRKSQIQVRKARKEGYYARLYKAPDAYLVYTRKGR